MIRPLLFCALTLFLLTGCVAVPTVSEPLPVPVSPWPAVASHEAVTGHACAGLLTAQKDIAGRAAAIAEATLRPDVTLPTDLASMTQYSLTVTLSPDLARLAGTAEVRYTNREQVPLAEVYFHLFPNLWDGDMSVTNVRVTGQPTEAELVAGDDLLRVPLIEALPPGAAVTLVMDFSIPIPAGRDIGNYGELAHQDGILALAHFYPTVVVYDDAGWHLETPAAQGDVLHHDASLYVVSLTAPGNLAVAATGATLARTERVNDMAAWCLVGGPLRDFNIVASANYQWASETVGTVTLTSYFPPEVAAGGKQALQWAAQALQTFEAAFGPYPYRELDIAATATTAGGIEYPGLIVVSRWLYDEPSRADFFQNATVHEVAHQWWYNVVGNDQVNAPWLDEALAQYSTYLHYGQVYGPQGAEEMLQSFRARWARVNYEEKPIGLPVSAYRDREYGAIVYGRGPLFLMALRDRLGGNHMAALLRRYYAEYAWAIAQPAAFKALAEQMVATDLDDLWARWVDAREE